MASNEIVRSRWYQVMFVSIALVMILTFALMAMPPRSLYGFQFQVIRDGHSLKIIIRRGPEPAKWTAPLVSTAAWVFRQTARGVSALSSWSAKGRALMSLAFDNTFGKGTRLVTGSVHGMAYRLGRVVRRR